ncbi:Shedu immune nuclease family protein [Candidatus Methanomassiliicoccus intestinalis]|uniref:Shedu immune nuclease family protein n=1 Tax=Candidatus Methanomassiliicoccus intestinalis TaxID=1406512 RepID=UPI0037DC2257
MKIDLQVPEVHDMTTDTVDVISTSSVTADASPVVLSQTETLRFKFCPTFVDNGKEPHKSVSGKLLYERKRKNDTSFPSDNTSTAVKISRGSAKVGDWIEIRLNTSETYELYQGLKQLYTLYNDMDGIPHGSATYTRVDSGFRQFYSIIQNDPSAARIIGSEENYDLVKTLLCLITQTSSRNSLKRSLAELQDENLQHLTTSLNIEKLQRIATLMQENLNNDSEEFWQTSVFKENQWVLAQIFACPCTIFADKAYVGGKGTSNTGGNLCDFIYQNSLSQNVALIEIKTPCTEIIGSQYRGTYSFSHELSGAVNQVLNYRDKLTKEYYSLCHQGSESFEVMSPKCVVIIGKMASLNPEQVAAFENFRNSLSNLLILTFDELYQRIVDLISALSESPIQDRSIIEANNSTEDMAL